MKVYELVKNINSKVSIKDTKIMEVKKYYLGLYRAYMVYLYDKGFISDPTVFNTKEILGNILDLKCVEHFGVSGTIELTEDYVGFALAKSKDNEEAQEFLSILLEVIKYRNIAKNIDLFYDSNGYSTKLKEKVSVNITQSASRITNKGGYATDEGILKCLKGKDKEFKLITFDDSIYKIALEELGIEDTGFTESIFVEGLTREEEVRYSKLILNGLVSLDGVHAKTLKSWLKDNKWAKNKFSSKQEGIYNWILYIKSSIAIEEQSKLLNELIDSGHNVVGMVSNGFFIEYNPDTVKLPIGLFSVFSDDEEGSLLPDINKLDGYTGEVYSLDFLKANDINFVGCPIELYVDSKNTSYFVDKEQTDMKDSISWFKYMGADISFGDSSYKEGVFQEGSLEDEMYKLLEEGEVVGDVNTDLVKNIDNVKKVLRKKL